MAVEGAILDAVRGRSKGGTKATNNAGSMDPDEGDRDELNGVRDRVEDLISSIVGLEHIKCQVRECIEGENIGWERREDRGLGSVVGPVGRC
jgi:hypothetical protein